MSRIQTAVGGVWDAANPSAYAYSIYEIAFALENVCRWGGHSVRFYSVAEHSVRVAKLVEDETGDPRLVRAALLHDAAEAYLGDMPSPIKYLPALEGYRELMKACEVAIHEHFGLAGLLGHPAIKYADAQMLAVEREDLFRAREEHVPAIIAAWAACPELPRRPRACFVRAVESDQGWSNDFINEWRRAGGEVQ